MSDALYHVHWVDNITSISSYTTGNCKPSITPVLNRSLVLPSQLQRRPIFVQVVFDGGPALSPGQFPAAWRGWAALLVEEASLMREPLEMDTPAFACISALILFRAGNNGPLG